MYGSRGFLAIACILAGCTAVSASCKIDADCQVSKITGVHSLFCVDGLCTQLKPPGSICTSPSECASYPFFGPLACSDKCKGGFCCRFIPTGAACSVNRPVGVNGCTSGFVCSNKDEGPVCAPSFGRFWALGPVLSVIGNLCINMGLNLQKKSYTVQTGKVAGYAVDLFRAGVGIYILGKLSGFSSYVFGNQSLMTSLGAVGLIANSIFAPMINREVFTFYDFISIVFILLGSSLILSNAGGGKRSYSLVGLLKKYFDPMTFLWFLFLISVITGLFIGCTVIEENSDWRIGSSAPWVTLDHTFSKNGYTLKYFMVFVYIGIAACIASFTTLFAKSFGVMVSLTVSGQNQFTGPGPYIFASLIVLCTIGQVYWLNRALKRYDALLVIPVFHIIWTLTSVTTAGMYFKDFSMFTSSQFNYFLLGLLTIFIGSFFLVFRMVGKDSPFTESENLNIETKKT